MEWNQVLYLWSRLLARMTNVDDCGATGGVNDWQWEQKYSEKTYRNDALASCPGLEPEPPRSEAGDNRLSYSALCY